MTSSDYIEWATVSGKAVVSSPSGEYWIVGADNSAEIGWLTSPMSGPGTVDSTRGLLDGMIAMGAEDGWRVAARSGLPSRLDQPLSVSQYIINLIASYHNSKRTMGNYQNAARRFRDMGRTDIAAYLDRHAREERGHEKLALRDLEALGLPAQRLVDSMVPMDVRPLCELFDTLSNHDNPIGCIGYSYFFESAAARRSRDDVEEMQALSPNGRDATRFMRAHSAMGSEVDHVAEMTRFIAGLPADDRTDIAIAAYITSATVARHSDPEYWNDTTRQWCEISRAAGDMSLAESFSQACPV